MKRFVCLICASWSLVSAISQTYSLAIATDKTTSLIFPFPILHVDRGTKDILIEQVKATDNILFVKAATYNFKETNLSVVTEDGSIYTFNVSYGDSSKKLTYYLPLLSKGNISTYANGILDNRWTIRNIHERKWGIESRITGIYVKDDVIYYQILLCNHSAIDYDIDVLRFSVRDKNRSKRTAMQENEIVPIYTAGNKRKVKAHGFSVIVVALDKLTIPDAKFLAIQISEKNGGRNLMMRIQNKNIMKAIPLPDLQ